MLCYSGVRGGAGEHPPQPVLLHRAHLRGTCIVYSVVLCSVWWSVWHNTEYMTFNPVKLCSVCTLDTGHCSSSHTYYTFNLATHNAHMPLTHAHSTTLHDDTTHIITLQMCHRIYTYLDSERETIVLNPFNPHTLHTTALHTAEMQRERRRFDSFAKHVGTRAGEWSIVLSAVCIMCSVYCVWNVCIACV